MNPRTNHKTEILLYENKQGMIHGRIIADNTTIIDLGVMEKGSLAHCHLDHVRRAVGSNEMLIEFLQSIEEKTSEELVLEAEEILKQIERGD